MRPGEQATGTVREASPADALAVHEQASNTRAYIMEIAGSTTICNATRVNAIDALSNALTFANDVVEPVLAQFRGAACQIR